MNPGRWAIWTVAVLMMLSVIPYRREGPLTQLRVVVTVVALVLFILWLISGSYAMWHAIARPADQSLFARIRGALSGVVPWVLMIWLIGARWSEFHTSVPVMTPARALAAARLEQRVRRLAVDFGERHADGRLDALQGVADWITAELEAAGWPVRHESFEVPVREVTVSVANVVAERRGRTLPEEIVLVGAHYDTAPGSPGANDNASGVAALLELAQRWKDLEPERTLRLVAFTNEEPPFFMSRYMGSEVHAAGVVERGERIVLMISLETIGYFVRERESQTYPSPLFHLIFPSRGHFIALVGGWKSAGVIRAVARAMRHGSDVAVHWAALPLWVTGVAWSDHWPFARRGIPAFMVTDTALFRYPWYHTPDDLPERLDFATLAAVVDGIEIAVLDRVGRHATPSEVRAARLK